MSARKTNPLYALWTRVEAATDWVLTRTKVRMSEMEKSPTRAAQRWASCSACIAAKRKLVRMAEKMRDAGAVSYTHLDVYKRQVYTGDWLMGLGLRVRIDGKV